MKPSYKELYEAYLICDQERYKLLEENQKLKIDISARETVVDEKQQEIDRLNNNLKELSDFAIKIYQKELDKTSDWWLQEELKTSFDDINLSTNFRLEEELKEDNNGK